MHLAHPDRGGDLRLGESFDEAHAQDGLLAGGQRGQGGAEEDAVLDRVVVVVVLAESGRERVFLALRRVDRRGAITLASFDCLNDCSSVAPVASANSFTVGLRPSCWDSADVACPSSR